MSAIETNLLIRNARLSSQPANGPLTDIGIAEGRIVALTKPGAIDARGAEEFDVEGRSVLPGGIDVHVHLGNGSQSIAEDLITETRVAAAGGVTTICPYIISPTGYDDILRDLESNVGKLSLVDIFPQVGIVSSDQISDVARLHQLFGIRAFKCFMGYKGAEASPSGIRGIDDASILALMIEVAKIPGGRLAVHAENMEIIDAARSQVQAANPEGSLRSWTHARPRVAETEAIQRVLQFARVTGCAVTIPHISVGQDVALLREHAKGVDAIFETCPHFLLLSAEDDIGVWGKANPPLRSLSDQSALWTELTTGALDVLGSDHCPFDANTKRADAGIWEARPGIPNGSAVILPMMFDRIEQDDTVSPELVARVTSGNAAHRYRLADKGALVLGADADFVVMDPSAQIFDSIALGGVAAYSPYDGRRFNNRVWATVAGGELIFLDGAARSRVRPARIIGTGRELASV